MEKKLIRRVNLLTIYACVSTLILGIVLCSSFRQRGENVDELTIKRLNIVGEDGSLRLVISNETRQHPGRMDGQDLPKRDRPAGIIFFNNKGDECGGLTGADVSGKDTLNSGASFTMDNYRNDQVVEMVNEETYQNGKANIRRGFVVNEFPVGSSLMNTVHQLTAIDSIKDAGERAARLKKLKDKEWPSRRLFVGRDLDDNSGLFLYDDKGRPRLKIYVDKDGHARLEELDEKGNAKNLIKP
ncbi:hypothetical protein [Dinghuibacter silviterrae]|nr:hypothetical protein [Dinghuibacter silviterrae]